MIEDSSKNRVKVVCRIRPLLSNEKSKSSLTSTKVFENSVQFNHSIRKETETFIYDKVFGIESTQDDLFQSIGIPSIDEFIKSYNITVFAYGQTSSGKTYTLMNTKEKGLAPRMIEYMIKKLDEKDTLKMSFYEIYNEKVNDLIKSNKVNLTIKELNGKFFIDDLTSIQSKSITEIMSVLEKGNIKRKSTSTKMNEYSTRSHVIISFQLTTFDNIKSCLNIVDLAGSEKINKSQITLKQDLEETKNINQSLTTLGKVINSLSLNNNHIPYRESKLTKVLSEALGGDSYVTLLIHCSPSVINEEETLSTLRFGKGTKQGLNQPKMKEIYDLKMKLTQKDEQIEILKKMNQDLRKDLIKFDKKDFHKLLNIVQELKREKLKLTFDFYYLSMLNETKIILKCGYFQILKNNQWILCWGYFKLLGKYITCYKSIQDLFPSFKIPIENIQKIDQDSFHISTFIFKSKETTDWLNTIIF